RVLSKQAILGLVWFFRWCISPLLGPSCRFEPTCSRYTEACVRRFGAWRGVWLGVQRLVLCQPLHPGGWDPPPIEYQSWLRKRVRHGFRIGIPPKVIEKGFRVRG